MNSNQNMKVVLYCRVSSTNDRQNNDRQRYDLANYAKANNFEIKKIFSEKISGNTLNSEREVLKECLNYAKSENIDFVLFSELSRLGRNILQVQELIKWFSDNKINAFFQKEQLTLLNENGEVAPTTTILIACLAMVAQIERENIKYRLNSGRERAKTKGIKMGRKNGSTETIEDKKEKYPITINLLKKNYKMVDIVAIAKSKGEKISLPTIKRLKKLVS